MSPSFSAQIVYMRGRGYIAETISVGDRYHVAGTVCESEDSFMIIQYPDRRRKRPKVGDQVAFISTGGVEFIRLVKGVEEDRSRECLYLDLIFRISCPLEEAGDPLKESICEAV